ncbi:MAG: uncharacterized protein JWM89_772 [Acidimicrobiales bacterium]|nr:uncharacterized protein [Acidimicrobiales bacterium]
MINFRYHIVSLTAVFLALAVGLAMGTTFLNHATVDQLKRQIRSAERGIDKTNGTNQSLKDDLDRANKDDAALIQDAMSQLLPGQLTDQPVLVVAADGIDRGSLENLRTALTDAGADLRGTLILTGSLRSDAGNDDDLAAAVEEAPGTLRNTLEAKAVSTFATALRNAADREATSTAGASQSVQRLLAGGFLRFDAPAGASPTLDASTVLAGGGYRYVFVSGPDPKTPDDEFLLPVVANLAANGPAPIVVASAATGADAETNRTLVVGPIRNDKNLASNISTVDDLERFSGLVATVLAVRDLGAPSRGHYGLGDGASGGSIPTAP